MIPKKKSLLIAKYNKKIQNKININIKDYKNYCEQYTTIEIEIIPAKGKYGLFYNRKDFKNFHPYFNDNKKVTKQNYILKEDKVTKIRLVIDYRLKYPESSLSELSEIIFMEKGIRISKSGLNHRFRKIIL